MCFAGSLTQVRPATEAACPEGTDRSDQLQKQLARRGTDQSDQPQKQLARRGTDWSDQLQKQLARRGADQSDQLQKQLARRGTDLLPMYNDHCRARLGSFAGD